MYASRLLVIVGALTVVCGMAAPAAADDVDLPGRNNWYVAGTGGYTFAEDLDLDFPGTPVSFSLDDGYHATIALGHSFKWFRFEGEFGYRSNDTDEVSIDDVGTGSIDGDLTSYSGMFNAFYDVPICRKADLYFGGGIGAAYVEIDLGEVENVPVDVDADDTVFAYQLMAGVAWRLTDKIALTVGYRLWSTDDLDLDDVNFDAPLIHAAEAGLRVSF